MTNPLFSRRVVALRPPRIAQLLLLVASAFHLGFPVEALQYHNYWLSGAMLIFGTVVMMAGWQLFQRCMTPVCPTDTPRQLVTEGVYRFTRNPMYLGMTSILLGVALAVGSVAFYLVPLLFFVVMQIYFCPYEEQKLASIFGSQFTEYRQQVRRWI